MKTPILGAAYVARSINAADNRLINLYAEATPDGGKTAAYFLRCPGITDLNATTGISSSTDVKVRGLWAVGDYLYAVIGAKFFKIDSSWNATLISSSVSGTGQASMVDNGTQIFIATNPDGYIYNTSTGVFAQIGDPDFPGAVTVGYLDGYFVFNEPNSQRIWVTELFDGLSINPLDFASAEGAPDNVVSLIVDHREVWVFGTNSTEVWYDAGQPDFPLARVQGAFNEIGCAAPYSVAKMDNSVFWLGADVRGRGMVYKAQGYQGVRISTHAIEYAIQSYGDISDAVAYTYQQDGHAFYVLTFPSANVTWVYDAATQMWHQRGYTDSFTGDIRRHRGNCQAAFANKVIIGDAEHGRIGYYDFNAYVEFNDSQRWLRSWRALPTGENTLKRTAQHSLQLDCESGYGSDTAYDSAPSASDDLDPQVMLRWSDDGGHTWSNEHWRGTGAIGQYGQRVLWRRLGMTTKLRDRVYEVSGSDETKIAIMGAELIVSATRA